MHVIFTKRDIVWSVACFVFVNMGYYYAVLCVLGDQRPCDGYVYTFQSQRKRGPSARPRAWGGEGHSIFKIPTPNY